MNLNISTECLLVLIDLNERRLHSVRLQVAVERFLLSETLVVGQAGHNDFVIDKDKSFVFFVNIPDLEVHFSYGRLVSHHFLVHGNDVKESLAKKLRMGEVIITPHSVFDGNGYSQHSGRG